MRHLSQWCFGKVPAEGLGTASFHSPYPLWHGVVLRLLFPDLVRSEGLVGFHPCPCRPHHHHPLDAHGQGTVTYRSSCNPRGESGAYCNTFATNRNYFPIKQSSKTVDSTDALRVMGSLWNWSTHSTEIKMKLLRALTATRSQISLRLCEGYKIHSSPTRTRHKPQYQSLFLAVVNVFLQI